MKVLLPLGYFYKMIEEYKKRDTDCIYILKICVL